MTLETYFGTYWTILKNLVFLPPKVRGGGSENLYRGRGWGADFYLHIDKFQNSCNFSKTANIRKKIFSISVWMMDKCSKNFCSKCCMHFGVIVVTKKTFVKKLNI